jgi:hypothetical protein
MQCGIIFKRRLWLKMSCFADDNDDYDDDNGDYDDDDDLS